jgi:CheY-like chemotaxis protein
MIVVDKLLSGLRILVVEDEMLVLLETEDMLADLGCESVTTAATVDQAVDIVKAQRFDAALLDVNLSGDRSHRVADALAARGVPFAFATGYGGQGLRAADRDRPLLLKPFRSELLEEILSGLLSQGRCQSKLGQR